MNPKLVDLSRAEARARDVKGFDALKRWIVQEFCGVMKTRCAPKRTRALRELSLRANQVLREEAKSLTVHKPI